jgi:DNA polymerase-3 subunit epsilon
MPHLSKNRSFWWFVLVCVFFFTTVVISFAWMLWQQTAVADQQTLLRLIRQHASYLFGLGVIFLGAFGLVIDWIFRLYILPIDRIAEETAVIHFVNPSHRLRPEGSADVLRLCQVINRAAEHIQELNRSVDARIEEAGARAEQEKKILSAVIAELPEGVLVCNAEGLITLYNERAQQLLGVARDGAAPAADPAAGGFIGLGRSVFGVISRSLIDHALEDVFGNLRSGRHALVSSFMMITGGNRLLRADTVPILTPHRELTGFALILTDVSAQLEADSQLDSLIHSTTTEVRGALAGIRAAVEVMLDYPELADEKRIEFSRIIHRESKAAGAMLDRIVEDHRRYLGRRGQLTPMAVQDFLETVSKKAAEKPGPQMTVEPVSEPLWVRVDPYALALGVAFLAERMGALFAPGSLRCEAHRQGGLIAIDIIWPGPPVRMETLGGWEQQPVSAAAEGIRLTLKEIMERHSAELWSRAAEGAAESYLRILLPAADPAEQQPLQRRTILPTTRPVYYDFDLFSQPGQTPELNERPLADLSFTVFDTETTGLDPRGGDELVAIGAVRIVNGRLLQQECFEQLINPGRAIPWESIRIHGLQPEVLAEQPGVEQVLRQFHHFAEGTVLVAHNAAFDMRMLQLKEAQCGIRFGNPVLDTMLISAVLHPSQGSHALEAIAERLGLAVIGRHTALGDAMATAEIFLKQMALLDQAGIRTFRQVQEESQKTYYARLKYR